jgi:ribosome maturation factor RimP
MSELDDRVQQILLPILASSGLTLWDMEFQKHGPQWLLRIYLDRETGGVDLNDCEAVSRDLSAALDVEDIIPHAYTLEVSSPGLDRALTRTEHFSRFVGSAVRIKTFQQINGQKVFRGTLRGIAGDLVRIELEKTATMLEIPLDAISKASLEVQL